MDETFFSRIKRRLEVTGQKAAAASRKATGSPDTIRNMERAFREGKNRTVTYRVAERLAKALATNPAWLLTGEGNENDYVRNSVTNVPVLAWVSAGRLTHVEPADGTHEYPHLPFANLPAGRWVALTVQGESMNAVAPDGSMILVNTAEKSLANGGFYVFMTEDGETTFKQYFEDPERFEPVSSLTTFKTIFPTSPLKIVGRVRRVITEL